MRSNKLRELLSSDKPTLGVPVICPWPGIVEIIGRTGVFDYVEFVGEDMPWHLHDLENLSRATELYDMSSMMKVDQEPRTFLATRAVGSGIQNILFADIRGPDDAREAVASMRPDTPELRGSAGAAMRLSHRVLISTGVQASLAGWASVNEGTEGPQIWDVVESHISKLGTVPPIDRDSVTVTGT